MKAKQKKKKKDYAMTIDKEHKTYSNRQCCFPDHIKTDQIEFRQV